MRPGRAGWHPSGWIAFCGVLMLICMLAPVALGVAGTRLSGYSANGAVLDGCVRATLQPRPQIGLSWRPHSNRRIERSPWIRVYPSHLCATLPRLSLLPARGLVRFPAFGSLAGASAASTRPAP